MTFLISGNKGREYEFDLGHFLLGIIPCPTNASRIVVLEQKKFQNYCDLQLKVEKILKGSLDLIQSPSPSVKIQIMGGKVCLSCKGKTLLVIVNKLLKTNSMLTSPSNVLPYYLK